MASGGSETKGENEAMPTAASLQHLPVPWPDQCREPEHSLPRLCLVGTIPLTSSENTVKITFFKGKFRRDIAAQQLKALLGMQEEES